MTLYRMASVGEALKQRAKNLIEDGRLKNYVNIAGELVVINDNELVDGGLNIDDSSNRISFSKKYFPNIKDEELIDNADTFRRIFGGTDPMTVANPSPPCSGDDMMVIIEGLTNRFGTLRSDIVHLQSASKDTQMLRTKTEQLQVLRNFIYTIEQNRNNGSCEIYNTDGTTGISVISTDYDESVKAFLRKFMVFCLHHKEPLVEYDMYNKSAELFENLFIDTAPLNQEDLTTYINTWKAVEGVQLPSVIPQILEVTGDRGDIQIEKERVQKNIVAEMRRLISQSLGATRGGQRGGGNTVDTILSDISKYAEIPNTTPQKIIDYMLTKIKDLSTEDKSLQVDKDSVVMKLDGVSTNLSDMTRNYKICQEKLDKMNESYSANMNELDKAKKDIANLNTQLSNLKDIYSAGIADAQRVNRELLSKQQDFATQLKNIQDMYEKAVGDKNNATAEGGRLNTIITSLTGLLNEAGTIIEGYSKTLTEDDNSLSTLIAQMVTIASEYEKKDEQDAAQPEQPQPQPQEQPQEQPQPQPQQQAVPGLQQGGTVLDTLTLGMFSVTPSAALQKLLNDMKSQKEKLQSELTSANSKLLSSEGEAAGQKAEKDTLTSTYDAQIKTLEESMAFLEANTAQLLDLQTQLQTLQASQLENNKTVTDQKAQLAESASALQKCNDDATADKNTLKEINKDLSNKLDATTTQVKQMTALQELFTKNQKGLFQGVIDAKTAEVAAIQAALDQINKKFSNAVDGSEEFNTLTKSVKAHNERLASANNVITTMNTYLSSVTSSTPPPSEDMMTAIAKDSNVTVAAIDSQIATNNVIKNPNERHGEHSKESHAQQSGSHKSHADKSEDD